MRMTAIVFAVALSIAGSASAQDWDQYVSTQDGFKVDFPGTPKIAETTYKSEYGYMLPARMFTVDKGKELASPNNPGRRPGLRAVVQIDDHRNKVSRPLQDVAVEPGAIARLHRDSGMVVPVPDEVDVVFRHVRLPS